MCGGWVDVGMIEAEEADDDMDLGTRVMADEPIDAGMLSSSNLSTSAL